MAHIYIHLYRKDKRITRVQFSTAVPVSEEVKVHLQNKLKEETGSTIEFSGIVQPELIGGFRLRIGNYRIDASYATQLRDIRSRLLENRIKTERSMTDQIKVSEVSAILRQQLEGISTGIRTEEVGTVLQVSDGVAGFTVSTMRG